jgi:toxin ParE1/3/4
LKPARLRPLAEEDLVAAVRHNAAEGGRTLGERAFDAALSALEQIGEQPASGSPRLGALCEIPGLRSWPVRGFPLRWMYFEADAFVDVVRLLGERQDIAAILRGTD